MGSAAIPAGAVRLSPDRAMGATSRVGGGGGRLSPDRQTRGGSIIGGNNNNDRLASSPGSGGPDTSINRKIFLVLIS